jgi:hypothetical protein
MTRQFCLTVQTFSGGPPNLALQPARRDDCVPTVPGTPSTLAFLRGEAKRFQREGSAALERGDNAAADAAFNRAAFCELKAEEIEAGLSVPEVSAASTLGAMEATAEPTKTLSAALSAAVTDLDHITLFQKVLQENGHSLREWALAQKKPELNPNTAQAWVKRGKGGRPAPWAWVQRIAKQFKCPDLLLEKHWRNGIRR